jgi:sugar phosphate isomerase/epimerase
METIDTIIPRVQVNIPFTLLYETYLEPFIKYGLNPEIGLDAAALDRFSIADFSKIAAEFEKHSRTVTLHGPFIDLNAGSSDPAIRGITRRRMEQLVELVPLFKPLTVICHAGYDTRRYGYFKENWSNHSTAFWSWMADQLAVHGARLMLENVYEDGPDDILFLFEKLKSRRVGFCLDTGHALAFGQSDIDAWLDLLGPYMGQLHLHDNNGKADEHLAIGSGIVDFNNLFRYLKTGKTPSPIITLEPHAEQALWPSLEYLARKWCW